MSDDPLRAAAIRRRQEKRGEQPEPEQRPEPGPLVTQGIRSAFEAKKHPDAGEIRPVP